MIVDVGSPVTVFAFQVISHAGIEIPHRPQMQHILLAVLVPVKARRGGFAVQGKFIDKVVLQEGVHVDVPGQCIQRDCLIGRCRHIRHNRVERIVKVLDSLLQQSGIILCHRFLYHEVLAGAVVLDPNILGGIKRLILLHKNALGIVQIQAGRAELHLFAHQICPAILPVDPEIHVRTVRYICHPQLFSQVKRELVPHHAVIRCVGQQHPFFSLCHAKNTGLLVEFDLVALFLITDPRGIPASLERCIRHVQVIFLVCSIRQRDRRACVFHTFVLMHRVQRDAVQRNIQAGQLRLHHRDGFRRTIRKADNDTVAILRKGAAQHVGLGIQRALVGRNDRTLQLYLCIRNDHLIRQEQIPLLLLRIVVAMDHIPLLVCHRAGEGVVGIGCQHAQHDCRHQDKGICQLLSHASPPTHSFSRFAEKSSLTRVRFGL